MFNIALKIFLVKLKLNILEKIRNFLLLLHRNKVFAVSVEKIVFEKIKTLINLWSFFRLKLWIILKQQQTTNVEAFSATVAASLWAFDKFYCLKCQLVECDLFFLRISTENANVNWWYLFPFLILARSLFWCVVFSYRWNQELLACKTFKLLQLWTSRNF